VATLLRFEFDAAYLDRLIAGDSEVESHFTSYFGELIALKLRSRLRSPALVEDVKQETFLRVIRTLREKGLASAPSLGAFVNSVCNNVLFETYRTGSKTAPLEDDYDGPDERRAGAEATLLADEQREKIQQVLSGLPKKDQELLRLLFIEERDKDDICQAMNVDRNYLRVLLHRAKAHFKDRWTEVTP